MTVLWVLKAVFLLGLITASIWHVWLAIFMDDGSDEDQFG